MRYEKITGKIQGNERGYAFLLPDDKTKGDYFISHSDLKGAMHGDTVICETREDKESGKTTARVLKVVERGIKELVGTYIRRRNDGYVIPDNTKYFNDIYVPSGKEFRAKTGDKVAVRIVAYARGKNPEGIVKSIFGRSDSKKAQLEALYFDYKIPREFPLRVKEEAEKIAPPTGKWVKDGRKDFTGEVIFTIDGDNARDFDDAVSVKKEKGKYVLGVHIADVSHYVKYGDAIDEEAFNRGTSVYFPELVSPMLPEKLCNDVCSLVEGKERLTLSCVMTVDKSGKVVNYEITPSLIKSRARMTYNNAQKILDGDKTLIKKYGEVADALFLMKELKDVLMKKREKNGTIDLDVKESEISVNENGGIEVRASAQNEAQKIIEEFMILANCTVAEYMFYSQTPAVYRIHKPPEKERVDAFLLFLKYLGVTVKTKKDEIYPKDYQKILEGLKDSPLYSLVNKVMLRSMQKARYSSENYGHFGLSERFYCHFTSPIRRYPDLTVHRIVKASLGGNLDLLNRYAESVSEIADFSSEREKVATEAERAVDDYYKTVYASERIGCRFSAVVSGVIAGGIFCELENGVEGYVEFGTGRGVFDKEKYSLTVGKKTYRPGLAVNVEIIGADATARRIEMKLCKDDNRFTKEDKVL